MEQIGSHVKRLVQQSFNFQGLSFYVGKMHKCFVAIISEP
jgi:hypothetical protein